MSRLRGETSNTAALRRNEDTHMYRNTPHHPHRWRVIALLMAGGLAPVVAWADPADAAPVHCYGFEANIVGTEGSDIIDAADGVTDRRDVIAGRAGTISSPGSAATTSSAATTVTT